MSFLVESNSFALARAMCTARDWSISNLALQKSIYIADMVHIGRYHIPITEENFEAWDYGPVLPSVYNRAKIFGSSNVEDIFPEIYLTPKEQQTVEEVAAFVAQFTPGQLVNLTHSQEGAWSQYYKSGWYNNTIPKQAEIDEFRKRQQKTA